MTKNRIRSVEDALVYITECNLATVEMLAMKKNPPKGEFQRQIDIAQLAIYNMIDYDVDFSDTRADDTILAGNVKTWAFDMHNKFHPKEI